MSDSLSFLENKSTVHKVSVVGVPLDLGKDTIGTDTGPAAIRAAGLMELFSFLKIEATDCGDLVVPLRDQVQVGEKNVKYLESIVASSEAAAKVVHAEMQKERVVFALGGDHSIAIGTIAGAAAATETLGVIWIDAHGDMMTHENTLSGNIHGMPSAVAFGVGHPKLTSVYEEKIKVLSENMLYIGLKDLDQAEIDLIREKNITAFTIFDILENSWSPIFAAIKAMAARVDRVWVSLDIDSIDQIFAPATPMVNNGGLTYREITNLARYIGKVVPLAGVDIVEFAPALDVENKTAKLILELIAGLCGAEYGWYQHYMQQEMNKQTER